MPNNWKKEFEKKHWGAMFESGDYDALIADIETEIIEKLIDEMREVLNPTSNSERFNRLQQLKESWLTKTL